MALDRKFKRRKDADNVAYLEGQIDQWEATLYAHELNLHNLSSLPDELRDESTQPQIEYEQRQVGVLEHAIGNAHAEIERLKPKKQDK